MVGFFSFPGNVLVTVRLEVAPSFSLWPPHTMTTNTNACQEYGSVWLLSSCSSSVCWCPGSQSGPNLGAKSTEDHLRGCALSLDERVNCDDGRETELSSSAISIMASPDNVASVSVGEVGECGAFSSVRVSPVIVRARDITTVGLTRRENGVKCQKLLRNCEKPVKSIAELWLNDLWRVNRLCTHC
jgi:hypothetical protein